MTPGRDAKCQHTFHKAAVTNAFGTWLFFRTTELTTADTELSTSPLPSQLPGEKPLISTAQKWLGFSSHLQVVLSPRNLGTGPIQAVRLLGQNTASLRLEILIYPCA